MSIVFIFIDGLGLGPALSSNPFFTSRTPFFSDLLEGASLTIEAAEKKYEKASLLALDPVMGVEGLPQSATGQTSLFTGTNAQKYLGKHLRGFPNRALRNVLAEKGMFLQLKNISLKGTFANAYRPDFFKSLNDGKKKYFSCSTLITYYAGLQFRNLDDLRNGNAVYKDITHESLKEMGFHVPPISPLEAGKRLMAISRDYDLTLYEHFRTDTDGHKGDYHKADQTLIKLDAFLGSVVENMDPENEMVFLCSDHGNMENLEVRAHTLNPVPALIIGKDHHKLAALLEKNKDISSVLPALLELLSSK
ncbi:MAG: metalloenzyme [Bacillota bacterium]|nr:metalloenzyme [Bacillota bacterium]